MANKNPKVMLICALLVSTSLAATGQLLFKYSLLNHHIAMPYLAIGVVAYVLSTAVYLYVLSRSHLSWTYTLGGLSYVFAVILASIVLHETVTLQTWAGVLCIAIGAALVGLS